LTTQKVCKLFKIESVLKIEIIPDELRNILETKVVLLVDFSIFEEKIPSCFTAKTFIFILKKQLQHATFLSYLTV